MTERTAPNEEHREKYARAIREAKLEGTDRFQSWFNKSGDINQAILRGYWDFALHILTPEVAALIRDPEKKVALEIGYGGGRILNAACSYFKEVIGIDVHDEQEAVKDFLGSQGKHNYRLLATQGDTIEATPESIDFIYSFIVLQHLPSFAVFVNYLKETYRCLKKGGVAQLYFGKYSRLGISQQFSNFLRGYCEIPEAPVNHTSLVVRVSRVKRLCRDIGFNVVGSGTSYKTVPDGYRKIRGGQNYVTLLKN